MVIDEIKDIPIEKRKDISDLIKGILSIAFYLIVLNNPEKAGMIKFIMKILKIPLDIFDELTDD